MGGTEMPLPCVLGNDEMIWNDSKSSQLSIIIHLSTYPSIFVYLQVVIYTIYIRHHWTMFRTSPGLWYLRGLQLSVVLDLRHENCHLRGCHWSNTSRNVHGLSNMVPECVDFPCYHVCIYVKLIQAWKCIVTISCIYIILQYIIYIYNIIIYYQYIINAYQCHIMPNDRRC